MAHTTGVGFDASWDPILWLVAGHELHLVSDDLRRDPGSLAAYFAAQGISAWETTPGYLRQLLAEPGFTGLLASHAGGADAFSLALGGEAFDAGLWTSVAALPGVRAWNLYGPTEATVDTVVAAVADSDAPVLGRPTAGHPALRPGRQAAARPARRRRRTVHRRHASWPAATAAGRT